MCDAPLTSCSARRKEKQLLNELQIMLNVTLGPENIPKPMNYYYTDSHIMHNKNQWAIFI